LIVVGPTGSGKTTQVPQYLFDRRRKTKAGQKLDLSGNCLAITQPRRVAAKTVAQRVAREMGTKLGDLVGYRVRFENRTSKRTRIVFLTDGMLLRECLLDKDLNKYHTVILDEAHERSLNTDILFALLKGVQKRRTLKLVAMSATLQATKFTKYFDNAPVVAVPGRTFPVEIMYLDKKEFNHIDATILTIRQLHQSLSVPGDILVFLTGQEEIESVAELLTRKGKHNILASATEDWKQSGGKKPVELDVRKFYAALPPKEQARVFETTNPGCRKIVLATNVAETSLTIPGITHIIDSGLVKRRFCLKSGLEVLKKGPIARAEAWQRSGRAGRERPGTAFRLYTEEQFDSFQPDITPEIQRADLGHLILNLKSMGVVSIRKFDFMDRPSSKAIKRALIRLMKLGALDKLGRLTSLGSKMVAYPLDPMYSKAIIESEKFQCSSEIIAIVALLAAEGSIWFVPHSKRGDANLSKKSFAHDGGDALSMLQVYQHYVGQQGIENKKSWCSSRFVNYKTMRQVADIHGQLAEIFEAKGTREQLSCLNDTDKVRRCLASALFLNSCRILPQGGYRTLDSHTVYIHPSSCLFQIRPPPTCLLFNEMLETKRQYIRDLTVVDEAWVRDLTNYTGTVRPRDALNALL